MTTTQPSIAEQTRHIRNVAAKVGRVQELWEDHLSGTRPPIVITALRNVITAARRALTALGTDPNTVIEATLNKVNERMGREPAGLDVTAARVASWLDEHAGSDIDQQGLRILKLMEEAGEVAQAWIGYTAQNPRKGRTHTAEQVAAELGDVIITAATAAASIDPAQVA